MIVGFSLDGLDAEKTGTADGNIDVNYSSSLTNVEEAEVAAIDENVARIFFELGIDYSSEDDDIAKLSFRGSVLWKENAGDVIESWEDEEEIDEGVSSAVTNHVYRKCISQAVSITDSLDLPSPVPIPRVRNQ